MDALCHAKFANHHCWFDALALTQTGYEVSCESFIVCYKNHLVLLVIDYAFKE